MPRWLKAFRPLTVRFAPAKREAALAEGGEQLSPRVDDVALPRDAGAHGGQVADFQPTVHCGVTRS